MDGNNNGSFWPSYVDIMTTLFAIMLVLFAVSFSKFKIKENQLQALVDEYDDIITVYSTVSEIDASEYFDYNKQYLKHLFTIDVEYDTKQYKMDRLLLDKEDKAKADLKRDSVVAAGKMIKETIEKIERLENADSLKNNIKFLVVIEGQSSRVRFDDGDWMNNYTLSYLRAQFLNKFWIDKGIDLSSIPRCELIISGSGEQGVPRVVPDEKALKKEYPNAKDYQKKWLEEETKNQRFLVHIVPVIGNIDVTKSKLDAIQGRK
jgi:Asp-tRNA(Asn)/Glu-tRNA(Gln) amidotransferase C subunit